MTIGEARIMAFQLIRWEGQSSISEYLASLEQAAQFLVNGPAHDPAAAAPSEDTEHG